MNKDFGNAEVFPEESIRFYRAACHGEMIFIMAGCFYRARIVLFFYYIFDIL
jgi:hypothetical protein